MNHAKYEIIDNTEHLITIIDVGLTCISVTNDAEWIVSDLSKKGYLTEGKKLRYFDSSGENDEILVRNGIFAGFAP